jgi:WD40 repeat protein
MRIGVAMRFMTRSRIPLGLLVCVVFAPGLRSADEPAGDLTPVLPVARSLTNNNNPYQFRNYGNGGVHSLSADGKTLLTIGNGLTLWKIDGRREPQMRNLDTGPINMYNCSGALSPTGKLAAIVPQNYGGDMAVRFFDTATGKSIREIDNDQQIFGLAFAPDGRILAVSTQQRIELWNADTGEEVRLFAAAQNVMYRLMTFSPDGKMIAALGNEPDTVHIWETASGKERGSVHFGAAAAPVPMGRMGKMRIWNGNPNVNGITALAFSADSRLLAVSKMDSAIHLWDLHANEELAPLTGIRSQVSALVFSPDGKDLIGIDNEGTHLTWHMAKIRRNTKMRLAALDDDDFAELWNDLAEPDIFRTYRARRHLVADAKRAVPLLSSHLEPVPAGEATRIQALVKDLSSPNGGTRRKAMTELRTKHGEAALGALAQMAGGNANGGGMPGMGGMGGMGGGAGNAPQLLMQKLQALYNTPERQRDLRAVHILEEIGTPQARQTLSKLAKGAAGTSLTVESKGALDRLSAAVKERPRQASSDELWTDLGSDDAAKAFKAMCSLSAAPEQTVALFRKQLKPVPIVEDKEIAALLDNLAADDFKVREQATADLAKVGEQALPAMKKALAGDVALEARKRLERLVEQASAQASAPLLRALRAVELLEHSGSDEGKHVLLALSGGAPQARLTREAKSSLQRIARR